MDRIAADFDVKTDKKIKDKQSECRGPEYSNHVSRRPLVKDRSPASIFRQPGIICSFSPLFSAVSLLERQTFDKSPHQLFTVNAIPH